MPDRPWEGVELLSFMSMVTVMNVVFPSPNLHGAIIDKVAHACRSVEIDC